MEKNIVLATLSLLPLATVHVDANSIGVVRATSLNVRSGPGQNYNKIFTLSKDEKVTIKSSLNGWYNIKNSNNREGWASAQYIEVSKDISVYDKKYVSVDRLNMRSGPSTSYRIVTILSKGSEVEILSTSNNWSKVKYNDITGYVSNEYLSNSFNSDNGIKVVKNVNVSSLNVRSGPSTSYSILGKLKLNEKIEVLDQTSTWSKVNYNGKIGYVSTKYLSNQLISDNDLENIPTTINKKVIATSLNIRSGSGTSYSKIGILYKGSIIKGLSEKNGWVEIKHNNQTGYVSSDYVVNTSESEGTTSGGTGSISSSYVNLTYSLGQHVDLQYQKALKGGNIIDASLSTASGSGYINATREDLNKYLNPNNFTGTQKGLNQFIRIDSYKGGVTADELNRYLNNLKTDSTGNNIFYNKGQAFIDAAKKSNIDLAYLVSHAMVETGYGTSTLAKGQEVNGVIVYNFFGIGAYDGTALVSGKNFAYKMGWTSVEKTLDGSAQWLANNYIKSSYKQNTLYKMRWSYESSNHQYATDVNWANLIASVMMNITSMYNGNVLSYEIPRYK